MSIHRNINYMSVYDLKNSQLQSTKPKHSENFAITKSVTALTHIDPNCRPATMPCCPALLPRPSHLPVGSLGVFVLEAASGDGWCFHSENLFPEVMLAWVDRCSAYRPAAALARGHERVCDHITMKLCSLMFSSRLLRCDMVSQTLQTHNVSGKV